MNEFDGHVLRIGSIRPTPEGQQTPSAQKAFRHLAASQRQARRFLQEELLRYLVPREQSLLDLTGQPARCRHITCPLTNSRQRVAHEHVYDATATVKGRN